MKKLLAACAFAAALATGAAFAETIENSYGNTIVVTYPNGAVARYYFNEDGTFTAKAPGGTQMAGRWEIAGEQLCFISPSTQRTCTEFVPGKNVGDTWTQRATDGSEISVQLVEGR
jgi:hypothetical protein